MNLYKRFQGLIPTDPLRVGQVTSINSDGTSTVTLTGGGSIRARGDSVSVGQNAFVQGGEIRGEAPTLPIVVITV